MCYAGYNETTTTFTTRWSWFIGNKVSIVMYSWHWQLAQSCWWTSQDHLFLNFPVFATYVFATKTILSSESPMLSQTVLISDHPQLGPKIIMWNCHNYDTRSWATSNAQHCSCEFYFVACCIYKMNFLEMLQNIDYFKN